MLFRSLDSITIRQLIAQGLLFKGNRQPRHRSIVLLEIRRTHIETAEHHLKVQSLLHRIQIRSSQKRSEGTTRRTPMCSTPIQSLATPTRSTIQRSFQKGCQWILSPFLFSDDYQTNSNSLTFHVYNKKNESTLRTPSLRIQEHTCSRRQ